MQKIFQITGKVAIDGTTQTKRDHFAIFSKTITTNKVARNLETRSGSHPPIATNIGLASAICGNSQSPAAVVSRSSDSAITRALLMGRKRRERIASIKFRAGALRVVKSKYPYRAGPGKKSGISFRTLFIAISEKQRLYVKSLIMNTIYFATISQNE